VPVLYMQVDEVSRSIRAAVLAGAPVSVSFVAVPGMAMIEDVDSILPGETHPLSLVPHGTPSTGAMWDLSTLDLDRFTPGIQQNFLSAAPCKGLSFHWDPAMHLLTTTVSANAAYPGSCAKTY